MSGSENKKIMAENIQYYMKKSEKSRQDMCDALGVKYTTFTDWVKGNSYPRIDKIELMANYFGISKADLVEKREPDSAKHHKRSVTINVYSRIAAGIPAEITDNIIDTEEIPEELAQTGEFFALKIHGDSMEPRMKEGDVVIVRQQEEAESGSIVVATVNEMDATCKRLKKYSHGIALLSANPAYDPMYFSNEETITEPVKILGKVIELRAKFD